MGTQKLFTHKFTELLQSGSIGQPLVKAVYLVQRNVEETRHSGTVVWPAGGIGGSNKLVKLSQFR